MTLAELRPGDHFTIIRNTMGNEIGKRLADMGFTTGAAGKLIRVAHVGDPIEIAIRGYHVSLRKSEASGIEVSIP